MSECCFINVQTQSYSTFNKTNKVWGNITTKDQLEIDALYYITEHVYRGSLIPLIIFGTIGNVINMVILGHKDFRTCSSCFYLFGATVVNCVILPFAVLRRLLVEGYGMEFYETRSIWWCRICYFIAHVAFYIAAYLLVLSSLDRYLRSFRQVRYRQWCTLHVARRVTAGIVIIIFVTNSHILVFFEINKGECYAQRGVYRLYLELSFSIAQSLLTIIGMCTLGLLVARKARRQLQRRNQCHPRVKRLCQFRRTIWIQTVCLCIVLLPRSIQKIVFTVCLMGNGEIQPGTLAYARNDLKTAVFSVLELGGWSLLFYFYSLATPNIRSHAWQMISRLCRRRRDSQKPIDQLLPAIAYRCTINKDETEKNSITSAVVFESV